MFNLSSFFNVASRNFGYEPCSDIPYATGLEKRLFLVIFMLTPARDSHKKGG